MSQEYSDTIKNHYHNPRNIEELSDYTHFAEEINPLCGDEIKVYLKIENSKIENLSYEARGCMICVAAASTVSEYAKGKKLEEIKKLGVEQVSKLLNVSISPARESCAILILDSLREL